MGTIAATVGLLIVRSSSGGLCGFATVGSNSESNETRGKTSSLPPTVALMTRRPACENVFGARDVGDLHPVDARVVPAIALSEVVGMEVVRVVAGRLDAVAVDFRVGRDDVIVIEADEIRRR